MKPLRKILALFVLPMLMAPAVMATSLAAVADKPEGQTLRWKDGTIRLAVSSTLAQPASNIKTDSDVMKALQRAVRAWQSVADIEFVIEATERRNVSANGVAGDGFSLITIAPTAENVLLFAGNAWAEPAKTRVFYNRRGFITEADIVLNPYQQFSADGTFGTFDLEATFIHELGHLLGLGHSGVLSATMAGRMVRNGAFGFADLSSRTLSETDIAAVRTLYGVRSTNDTCCGSVSGRLDGTADADVRVWIEETDTGIVMAHGKAAADGTFLLGGLPAGTYSMLWSAAGSGKGSVGRSEIFELEKDSSHVVRQKITLTASGLELYFVGSNGQLGDSAVNLDPGSRQTIFLGGKGLAAGALDLQFNSPYLQVVPGSLVEHDFGGQLSVISFGVAVAKNAPFGEYSLYASNPFGEQALLVGAINVE